MKKIAVIILMFIVFGILTYGALFFLGKQAVKETQIGIKITKGEVPVKTERPVVITVEILDFEKRYPPSERGHAKLLGWGNGTTRTGKKIIFFSYLSPEWIIVFKAYDPIHYNVPYNFQTIGFDKSKYCHQDECDWKAILDELIAGFTNLKLKVMEYL